MDASAFTPAIAKRCEALDRVKLSSLYLPEAVPARRRPTHVPFGYTLQRSNIDWFSFEQERRIGPFVAKVSLTHSISKLS